MRTNPLTAHLRDVGETYTEHMARAAGFGWTMLGGAVACLIHALLPFLFVRTASNRVRKLAAAMANRGRAAQEPHPTPEGEAPDAAGADRSVRPPGLRWRAP